MAPSSISEIMGPRVTKCSHRPPQDAKETNWKRFDRGIQHLPNLQPLKANAHIHTSVSKKHNMTSHNGFTFGDDNNMTQHDLPRKCTLSVKTWSHLIHDAVTQKNAFPAGVCNKEIKTSQSHSGSRGCKASLAIIQPDHPNCHSHPAMSTKSPPNQMRSESMRGHFN